MNDNEREFLENEISRQHDWYNRGSKLWSAIHHWSLWIASAMSAAAVVIKIGWLKDHFPAIYANREDLVTCLAFIATLITAMSAAGGFGRKWQTNRLKRAMPATQISKIFTYASNLCKPVAGLC